MPGLAAIVRIMLQYRIDVMDFLEHPEKDWEVAIEEATGSRLVMEWLRQEAWKRLPPADTSGRQRMPAGKFFSKSH